MQETLKEIRMLERRSHFRVFLNGWSKDVDTVGYCYSPKTGKWGAYRRMKRSLETIVCDTEKEAAEAVCLLLVAER